MYRAGTRKASLPLCQRRHVFQKGDRVSKRGRKRKRATRIAEAAPKPTPGLTIRDPIAELAEKLDRAQREYQQIMGEIQAEIAKLQDGHQETLDQVNETIEKKRKGKSAEDLERLRQLAGRQQAKEIGQIMRALEAEAKKLLAGPHLTFTPQVDDQIPYGSTAQGPILWGFTARVEGKYPKVVIEAHLSRQRGLAELRRTKTALGATGPGYAGELKPQLIADFVGHPRRPMAEHIALLREKGVDQRL